MTATVCEETQQPNILYNDSFPSGMTSEKVERSDSLAGNLKNKTT